MCLYTNITEQFFTPNTAAPPFLSPLGGSANLYYLCFKIDPATAFPQTGTAQVPTNYWLSVYVQTTVGNPFNFGWKTSATNYNDRAVWGLGNLPPPTGWTPMTDPRTQGPVNMAFKINTTSNTTSCVITIAHDSLIAPAATAEPARCGIGSAESKFHSRRPAWGREWNLQ